MCALDVGIDLEMCNIDLNMENGAGNCFDADQFLFKFVVYRKV